MRHDEVKDGSVNRIFELTDRLQEYLKDAAGLRERLVKAQDANRWPNLEGAVARVVRRRRSSDLR